MSVDSAISEVQDNIADVTSSRSRDLMQAE